MSHPGTPTPARGENERLHALWALQVLDTPAEPDFDDIASLAAELCETPMAAVSLVDADRQWFKAKVGLSADQTPREVAFCAHAMYHDDVMHIPDTHRDPRFAGTALVTGPPFVRFYAGAPLVGSDGHRLGSLCVKDTVPRRLDERQRRNLQTLARNVVAQLELRLHIRRAEATGEHLRQADRLKDAFISRVSHELRTPLTSIQGYLELVEDAEPDLAAAGRFLARIRRNSDRLLSLVDDLLLTARLTTRTLDLHLDPTDLAAVARTAADTARPLARKRGLDLDVEAPTPVPASADAMRLGHALDRLLLNAFTFTTTGGVRLRAFAGPAGRPTVEVVDTGTGMAHDEQERVFQRFYRASAADDLETQGIGLGLTIVKAIVDGHHGAISVASTPGAGTTVTITLPAA